MIPSVLNSSVEYVPVGLACATIAKLRVIYIPTRLEGGHNGREVYKERKSSWLPADRQFGYVQGVKVKIIGVSRQLRHDEDGNVVGAAPLDDSGHIGGHST